MNDVIKCVSFVPLNWMANQGKRLISSRIFAAMIKEVGKYTNIPVITLSQRVFFLCFVRSTGRRI